LDEFLKLKICEFNEKLVSGIDYKNHLFLNLKKIFTEIFYLSQEREPNKAEVLQSFEGIKEVIDKLSLRIKGKILGNYLFTISNEIALIFSRLAKTFIEIGDPQFAAYIYENIANFYEFAADSAGFEIDGYMKSSIRRPALFYRMRSDHTILSKPKKRYPVSISFAKTDETKTEKSFEEKRKAGIITTEASEKTLQYKSGLVKESRSDVSVYERTLSKRDYPSLVYEIEMPELELRKPEFSPNFSLNLYGTKQVLGGFSHITAEKQNQIDFGNLPKSEIKYQYFLDFDEEIGHKGHTPKISSMVDLKLIQKEVLGGKK